MPNSAKVVSSDEVVILLGNFAVSTSEQSFVLLNLYGKNLLSISRQPSGRIAITAEIWGKDGNLLVDIKDNKFRPNPIRTLPVIRADPHWLKVEDERKNRVLSARFINKKTIRVSGIFRTEGGAYPVVINKSTVSFGPLLIKGGIAFHVKGSPLLEWPGKLKGHSSPSDGSFSSRRCPPKCYQRNGAGRLYITDATGHAVSIMRIGGPDVPEGTVIYPFLKLMIQSPG